MKAFAGLLTKVLSASVPHRGEVRLLYARRFQRLSKSRAMISFIISDVPAYMR